MKKKLGLAAGTAVVGGIMLAMGINTIDSQPKFVEPTPVSTTTKSAKPTTVKPTKTKAPEISETKNSPKPKKTFTPEPTKTPVDLGAEPTVRTSYANCTDLRKDFPKGIPDNHPAYRKKFDKDSDGYACETD